MIISRVARRYAEAVFESIPSDKKEQFFSDVDDLVASLEKSKDLRRFFASPIIERSKKRAVVEAIGKEHFGEWMNRVLLLLIDKDREDIIAEILEALRELRQDELGIQPIRVSTAVALSDEMRNTVAASLEEFAKSKVDISYYVDEQLLGGVVVRKDDTVYDGSVQRQLDRLRRKFQSAS